MTPQTYCCSLLVVITGAVAAGTPSLSPDAMAKAIAIGRRCEAPIVRLSKPSSDFDGYVESPFARVALVTATAQVMHAALDAPGTRRAMLPGYRIWFERKNTAASNGRIANLAVRDGKGRVIPASSERPDVRLFLGTVASHGIQEAFRRRFPEYTFDALPADRFDVIVEESTTGVHAYRVTRLNEASPIRVCNQNY